MFQLIPVSLVPKPFRNERYGSYAEIAVSAAMLLTGFLTAPFMTNLEEGIFLRNGLFSILGHHGFVCPFCGATRAFFLCCRFDFISALHCSFLGVFFFLWIIGTLPVRFWFLMKKKACRKTWLNRIEYSSIPLVVTGMFFLIQLSLHYGLNWYWIPLRQL